MPQRPEDAAWRVEFSITISAANEAKTENTPHIYATTNNGHAEKRLEQEASEGKRRRANPEEAAQRKQQKCDMRKHQTSSKPVSYTHKPPKQQRTMRMTMSHVEPL